MGDPARFRLFADLIEREFPDRSAWIADVAAGKGGTKAALYQWGYRRVTCWDMRRRFAKGRPGQRYQRFDYQNAPRGYDLIVAMHPDEATDHAIMYAAKHRVPCVVCPCCIKPNAAVYEGRQTHDAWNAHLRQLAIADRMLVETTELSMSGRNVVMIMRPKGN